MSTTTTVSLNNIITAVEAISIENPTELDFRMLQLATASADTHNKLHELNRLIHQKIAIMKTKMTKDEYLASCGKLTGDEELRLARILSMTNVGVPNLTLKYLEWFSDDKFQANEMLNSNSYNEMINDSYKKLVLCCSNNIAKLMVLLSSKDVKYYELMSLIWGIDFKTACEVLRQLKSDPNLAVLRKLTGFNSGNC